MSDRRGPGQARGAWLASPILVALLAAPGGASPTPLPPRPTSYATDHAHVFSPERLAALNDKLADFERSTSNQIVVYVDRSIPPGTTLEELGAAAIREWGVGQKDRSNGAILFVFVQDRRMRLEVGYGLEGALPDARARQITSDVVKPFFAKGDYAAGIEAGVGAIMDAARGEGFEGSGRTAAESGGQGGAGFAVLGVAALVAAAFATVLGALRRHRPRDSKRFYSLAFLCALAVALFGGGLATSSGGWMLAGFGALIATLIVAAATRSSQPIARTARSQGRASEGSSSASSSSSPPESPSPSPSSDFSGGGGDGGGGGSSDSW